LDAAAAAWGMNYTNHFLIKLQWYDNYQISSDGLSVDDVTIIVAPVDPPFNPYNLNARDEDSTDYVHITWDAPASATYYLVYRSDAYDGTKTGINSPSLLM
jgi:hypothetical protein